MDLLCTENILHEYETEILCHHHHQQSLEPEQNQQQPQKQQRAIASNNSNTSPPSVYSSSSSLSSSSCSSTNSSGYNSSNSNSHSGSYHSSKHACEETSNSYLETSCGPPLHAHQQQQQQQNQLQQQHHVYPQKPSSSSYVYHGISNTAPNVYANNFIARSLDYVNTATEDPTFLTDRCLENALKAEEKRPQPTCTYFKTVQKDMTPPMRKIVAEWMMEVCGEEKCQEEVVLLALNYMDRFLSTKSVRKTYLQILAAACLLLASKLREPSCRALSAELLVFYTDNSIHKADLIKWELFVLSRLGWDLSCVTPLDFLELLLIRLPIRSNEHPDLDVDKVRQHAQAFISLAAKEHHFSMYSASTIAASSIAAALSGLNWHLRTGQNLRYLLNLLTDLTSVEQDYLHDCMMKMETLFEEHSRNLQPFMGSADHVKHQNAADSMNTPNFFNSTGSNSFSTMPSTGRVAAQSQYSQNHQYHHYQAYQPHENQQLNPHQHQHLHHHQHHHNSQHIHSASSSSVTPSASNLSSHDSVSGGVTANVLLPNLTQTCKMQANTQKEVQDLKF